MELLLIVSIWVLIAVLIDLAARDHLGLDLNGQPKGGFIVGPYPATTTSDAVNLEATIDCRVEEKDCVKECCAQPPDAVFFPYGTKVDVRLLGCKFAVGKIIGFTENKCTGYIEYEVVYKKTQRAYISSYDIRLHRTKKSIDAEVKTIEKRIRDHYECGGEGFFL